MTLTILTAEVLGRLKLRAQDSVRFKITDSLNEAMRWILTHADSRLIKNAVRSELFTLTGNIGSMQLPDEFIRILPHGAWVDYFDEISATNPGREARIIWDGEIHDGSNILATPSIDFPQISFGIEGGILIRPVPVATQLSGMRLMYVQMLPLISSTQECLLDSSLKNCVIYKASSLSAMIENFSPTMSESFGKLANDELGIKPKISQ